MKRLFCFIFIMILLFSLFACTEQSTAGDNNVSETTGPADTEPTPADTTVPVSDTEITDTTLVTDTDPISETAEDTTETPVTEDTAADTTAVPETTAHKHSYSLSSTEESTCAKNGTKIYTCQCGKSYSEDVPRLPHNYSLSSTKKSTCSVKGTKSYSCECGSSYSEELELLPHSYSPASCTTPEICSVCGHNNGGQLAHEVVNSYCTLCGKEVLLIGITEDQLFELVGQPDDSVEERTSIGTVTTYIYSSNMMKLRFYQVHNGTVSAMFSAGSGYIYCHMPTKKTHIPTAYDENMKLISDGNMDVLCFTDITGSKKMTSSWAKLSSFNYGFNTMSTTTEFKGETVTDYSAQTVLCLYLTNYYRALNGLSPLEYSNEASAASLTHSLFMAKTGHFEHTDLEGNRASYRLRNEGIDGVYCGENIQAGYFYINGIKTTNIFFVTHSWYTSPTHREGMLTPEYKYFGAGIAHSASSQYEYYSTQVFFRYP
ncbi:MAG: CAP domain-containing protein [Clostridia bacterium]|nr:CAP domain-containing protein [Clostridia bacterium]